MPADPIMLESAIAPAKREVKVAGGAAGNHAVAGIEVGDFLTSVKRYDVSAGNIVDVDVLTSEFTITADGTINNTGGTDTTGDVLIVEFYKHHVEN